MVYRHGCVRVALPAEGRGRLDSKARDAWRKHLGAIAHILRRKQVPARERDHSGGDVLGLEEACCSEAVLNLAPGPHEDDVWGRVVAVPRYEDVCAAPHTLSCELARLDQHRELLAGEHERGRAIAVHSDPPGDGGLVGICRPDHAKPWHGPQGRELLYGLVGRPVLPEADGV